MDNNTPSLVMHEVREIETWILRLLSAPVPVPGKTRVEVRTCLLLLYNVDRPEGTFRNNQEPLLHWDRAAIITKIIYRDFFWSCSLLSCNEIFMYVMHLFTLQLDSRVVVY